MNPRQVVSGNMVITHYDEKNVYCLMMRERTFPNGYIAPSKQINITPSLIAAGENPSAIADMFEEIADKIRNGID